MGEIIAPARPIPGWASGPDWTTSLERAGRRWADLHGVKTTPGGELIATWGAAAYCRHVLGHDQVGERRFLRRSRGRHAALTSMRQLGIRLLLAGLVVERWGGWYVDPDPSGRCPACRG